jgi:peptidyl-prolyl cis-trans isomerase C
MEKDDKGACLKRLVPVMLVVAVMILGCSKSDGGFLTGLGIKEKPKGQIVARVGDDVITDQQIEQFIKQLPPQVSARYSPREIRKEIAEGFLSMKMLAWEAKRRGIDKREDVQLRIATLQDQALAREVEEEIRESIKVEESETRKYYDDHKDRYAPGPRIHIRQIVVPTEADAKNVLEKLGKGADFAQTATQLSKDASAGKGGDMGWVTLDSLDPALKDVAAGLKEGQISRVVKTQPGFTIVKAEKVIAGRERPYDQVKPSIERLLIREKLNKAVEDMRDEIKKKAKVELNEKYFTQFQDTAPQAMPETGPAKGPDMPRMAPPPRPAQ